MIVTEWQSGFLFGLLFSMALRTVADAVRAWNYSTAKKPSVFRCNEEASGSRCALSRWHDGYHYGGDGSMWCYSADGDLEFYTDNDLRQKARAELAKKVRLKS